MGQLERALVVQDYIEDLDWYDSLEELLEENKLGDLFVMFSKLSYAAGSLKTLNIMNDDNIKDKIHALKSRENVRRGRWDKVNIWKKRAVVIAKERYENGDRTKHNEMAKDINKMFRREAINEFINFADKDVKISEEDLELSKEDLKKLDKKHREAVIELKKRYKIPSKHTISELIVPISNKYNCTRGI